MQSFWGEDIKDSLIDTKVFKEGGEWFSKYNFSYRKCRSVCVYVYVHIYV